ncbi:hypothetical protein [uncultured Robinsoniella sp.]|uniref:hypothetical protein n=1 Tax=uncultured Robinsoniella sp. TaxID=904190 RepID=UPI0029112149|nr:hypothetical protein [Clostridiales bacterium]
MNDKELSVLKLLTISTIAYMEWKNIITSKMRGNEEISKLFLELPTIQGLSNDITLQRLIDSEIDINNITGIEDVIKAMRLN